MLKGPDWDQVLADLFPVQDAIALGQTLAKDIADRIRRGVGTDNKPLPPHHVNLRKIRERWERKEGHEWNAETRAAADKADAARTSPISVIQQLRVLGGHTERPAAGITWVGYDNVIRYGRDARKSRGEVAGEIAFYQWNTRESFLAGNYGAHTGLRTGEMIKAITVEVSRTKAGRWLLRIGPKGRKTRNMPMYRLIQESKARNDAAAKGEKQRKFPPSLRMALLQRLGPHGKIAESESTEIGVLDPTDAVLSDALQTTIVNPMMARVGKARRVVVTGDVSTRAASTASR